MRRMPGRRFLRLRLGGVRAGVVARGLRQSRARVQLLLGDAVPQARAHHAGEPERGGADRLLPDQLHAHRRARGCAYFHAQFRRTNPLPYKDVYTILDGVNGHGQYVGTYMAWGVNNTGWWGEGEIKFFMDGDGEFPTICGTGTEDYFCGSYNFDPYVAHSGRGAVQQSRYQEFTTPYAGLPQVIRPDGVYKSQQRFGMYRWHIPDPIRFESDLRVTIQALGWRSGGQGGKISSAAGRHCVGRLLVPDAAGGAVSQIARRGPSRNRLTRTTPGVPDRASEVVSPKCAIMRSASPSAPIAASASSTPPPSRIGRRRVPCRRGRDRARCAQVPAAPTAPS